MRWVALVSVAAATLYALRHLSALHASTTRGPRGRRLAMSRGLRAFIAWELAVAFVLVAIGADLSLTIAVAGTAGILAMSRWALQHRLA